MALNLNEVLDFFFNLPKPSSRSMTVGLTQPRIGMSTRNFLDDKAWPANKANSLTTICELIVGS
jgi:hypothetical protein